MSDFFQQGPSLVEVLTDVWYEQPIIKSHDDIRKRKVYLDLYKQPILLLRWIFQNVIQIASKSFSKNAETQIFPNIKQVFAKTK